MSEQSEHEANGNRPSDATASGPAAGPSTSGDGTEDRQSTAQKFETHEVFNQSPAFEDLNLATSDMPLMEAVKREGGAKDWGRLTQLGAETGSREAFELGRLANENPPRLKRFDDKGRVFIGRDRIKRGI